MSTEYWKHDAGTESVAKLVIPASLGRERRFDLDATLLVTALEGVAAASHELSVEIDGQLVWTRRIPTHQAGESDGLEYHCRLTLKSNANCRVRAKASCKGARVLSLVLEARETTD